MAGRGGDGPGRGRGGPALGPQEHHPGHHHQHPGFGAAGHPPAPVRTPDRDPGEDHRRGFRPGPGHGRQGGGGRAPVPLPGCREEVHGRRERPAAPAGHAQRFRGGGPPGRPGRSESGPHRPGGPQEDRRPGPALVFPGGQFRHQRPGAKALEGRGHRPQGPGQGPGSGTSRPAWAWARPSTWRRRRRATP